ncbi:unnamed protein product [Albugo candida]|uniref:Uncharacterized protein n=1 Tax=Albugo candida TaxID=65357 RepID=A0A024G0F0_9STRA|nr:unnamed protein product [Albugo candida]|eukprot:CCI40134.1 unnamed protein product [Albugo candida]
MNDSTSASTLSILLLCHKPRSQYGRATHDINLIYQNFQLNASSFKLALLALYFLLLYLLAQFIPCMPCFIIFCSSYYALYHILLVNKHIVYFRWSSHVTALIQDLRNEEIAMSFYSILFEQWLLAYRQECVLLFCSGALIYKKRCESIHMLDTVSY